MIYVTKPEDVKGGNSLGVAAALSLLSLVLGRRADQEVVVTGAIDLMGNVMDVEGLHGKLQVKGF